MKKRLVSLMLCGAMLFSLCTPVSAAEETGNFTVTGGELNTDYSYADNTLTILKGTALTISGTTKTDKIIIKNGVTANVTLKNLNIDVSGKPGTTSFEVGEKATCNLTLTGVNTLKSGKSRAGLNVGQTASLTITENSTGSLDATGGENTAGIGSGHGGICGTITINGGTVTATGGGTWSGAGIGGGGQGAGGIITINGGIVIASGGDSNAAGIGGGYGGDGGTFGTDPNGNAFIIALPSISDTKNQGNWSGVIFEGNDGQVYGNQTISEDVEIPSGKTLTLPQNIEMTIPEGVTLTNNGAIVIEQDGTLNNSGTIKGLGTITGDGKLTGNKASQTAPNANDGYTINYTAETIEAGSGYEVSSSNSVVKDITDPIPDQTLYVRKEENDFYNASDWTSFTVADRPAAPTLTIDNADEGVTISSGYSYNTTGEDYSNTWTQGDGSLVSVQPGSSIYIYKAATASEFKSAVQTLKAPARRDAPTVSINYYREDLNVDAGAEDRIECGRDGTDWYPLYWFEDLGWDGTTAVPIYVRLSADRSNYASAPTGPITIPARPAAPTDLVGVMPTTKGGTDGIITGVTDDMEYSYDRWWWWEDCTADVIDGLSPGTYWVRYKATDTAFASDRVEVIVPKYTETATYTLTVNGGTGSGSYGLGDTVTIRATVPSGQRFTGWTVNEGGVTVPNTNPASFTMPAGDVTVTANFEAIPTPPQPTTYRVTVQIDGSGTASASPTYATRGTKITLTATAEEGYHFKEWRVISGGVTINNNSFTMPGGNVTVKAIFEQDVPVHTHAWAAA